jgi:RNA polymerase sigma factor (sigma-70 family)
MTDPIERVSAALEALVSRFGRMVRRVGFDHGLSEADVEEVVQEVRIRIWKARADAIGDLQAAYVYRAAVSAALDIIRRHRSGARFADADSGNEVSVASDSAADPQRDLEVSELQAAVALAVETLSEARRPVVRMYLQGYSREEIAELLAWSEGKTRNLLYRGLADLRAKLGEQGLGPKGEQ